MIGKIITEFDSVDSTSNYIAKAIEEGNYEWGTAILAHFQTNGRGQRAATWQSKEGQNLTFSFALPLSGFNAKAYFSVSRAISLGIYKTVKALVRGAVHIKWPNDTLVDRRKISGILIETNSGSQPMAICGIGLNVNQTEFSDLPNSTSLKLAEGEKFDLNRVLSMLLDNLNAEWDTLINGDFRNQRERYEAKLFGMNRKIFFREKGLELEGRIVGTTEDGRLLIERNGFRKAFLPQSIKLLY